MDDPTCITHCAHELELPTHLWLKLASVPYLGGATLRKLLRRFGSMAGILGANPTQLAATGHLRKGTLEGLTHLSESGGQAELEALQAQGIRILHWGNPGYPKRLFRLPDPPPVIFVRGRLPGLGLVIAVVGRRDPGERGLRHARMLSEELSRAGVPILSGMALGIDTAAHQGALAPPNGQTIAVLGSGLERLSPKSNLPLALRIAARGALLSELPMGVWPRAATLMARNRIIAALSSALVVVEAGLTGGTMNTAKRGQRMETPVFAVPGSPGTDLLLRTGKAHVLVPEAFQAQRMLAMLCKTQNSLGATGNPGDRARPEPMQGKLFTNHESRECDSLS